MKRSDRIWLRTIVAFVASLGGWLSIVAASLVVATYVAIMIGNEETEVESPFFFYSLIVAFFGSVGVWLIRVGRRMRTRANEDIAASTAETA